MAMVDAGLIDGGSFNTDTFDPATWAAGVSYKQYEDYPSISIALEAGEVDAFCVDLSILAAYKTAGRSRPSIPNGGPTGKGSCPASSEGGKVGVDCFGKER